MSEVANPRLSNFEILEATKQDLDEARMLHSEAIINFADELQARKGEKVSFQGIPNGHVSIIETPAGQKRSAHMPLYADLSPEDAVPVIYNDCWIIHIESILPENLPENLVAFVQRESWKDEYQLVPLTTISNFSWGTEYTSR